MINPQVGSWYRRSDRRLFEVVATDADDATVEIQFFDGTIGELELEAWHQLVLEAIPAPEDWSGPLDVVEPELRDRWETRHQPWPDHLSFLDQLDRR